MLDTTEPRTLIKNHILNALRGDAYERLLPNLEPIELPHGKFLYRAHEPIKHVFFPDDAVASVVAISESGQGAEICMIGREGAVGLEVLLGVDDVPHECVIQIPNGGWRIKSEVLKKEFDRDGETRAVILHFVNKMLMQISQTALCNRLHSVEERLTRWLLMSHDRAEEDKLLLTQEFLSIMLGVTRTSVTLSAITLQNMGFIKYSRGNINIIDRKGMEDFCCECYAIVKAEYDRK